MVPRCPAMPETGPFSRRHDGNGNEGGSDRNSGLPVAPTSHTRHKAHNNPLRGPMAEIRTSHLMTLTLAVNGMQPIGATPNGDRRVGLVAGGKFEGPKLRGTVLPGGADWIIGRPDGSTTLDVRIVLRTDDGAAIGMTYRGMRHGPAAVMDKVNAGQ